jgi:uncharacterized small protein (TIGR04563 family)
MLDAALTLHLPDTVLADMEAEASAAGRRLSWSIERAWLISRDVLRAEAPGTGYGDECESLNEQGDLQPHTARKIFFAPETMAELRSEADRRDGSVSWLVQRAWRLARSKSK